MSVDSNIDPLRASMGLRFWVRTVGTGALCEDFKNLCGFQQEIWMPYWMAASDEVETQADLGKRTLIRRPLVAIATVDR